MRPARWYRDPLYLRNRAILLATARCCALCGAPTRLTADHWPETIAASLAAGRAPNHSLANLRAACLPCNSSRRLTSPPATVGGMADVYRPARSRRRR